MDGKRHMETTDEYKLLLEYFKQPIEQMEWKYFEEKKFNCLYKTGFQKYIKQSVSIASLIKLKPYFSQWNFA